MKLIEHYGTDVGDIWLQKEIKGLLRAALMENGVFPTTLPSPSDSVGESVVLLTVTLIFEQQK